MKRVFFIVALLIVSVVSVRAQKIGFINTDSILSVIPDYTKAQATLKELAASYRAELEKDLQNIDNAYTKYQQQKQYLTASSCASREQQIISLENALKKKQDKYFGTDGELSKRSEELLTPIKNKVNELIGLYSAAYGYSVILDIAATSGMIYYNKEDDITKIIIEKLK